MSITLQILGALAVALFFATLLLRPDGILLPVFAAGFVIAGIFTCWSEVKSYQLEKATARQPLTASAPSPPWEYPRSGS